MSDAVEARKARFRELADALVDEGGAQWGTIMGFDCIRVDGDFLATSERAGGDLVVKLDPDRVRRLIDEGTGRPFAPAGRVFGAWVAVPDEARWPDVLEEALEMRSA